MWVFLVRLCYTTPFTLLGMCASQFCFLPALAVFLQSVLPTHEPVPSLSDSLRSVELNGFQAPQVAEHPPILSLRYLPFNIRMKLTPINADIQFLFFHRSMKGIVM